ncbi:MAG: hypothetical protein NXI08_10855 [bacterium]|nr:hypothetical protein [bacterium]
MKKPTLYGTLSIIFLSFITSLFGCITADADIDAEKLEQVSFQLAEIYTNCKEEGINDQKSLEDALNSGGNNISKKCRTTIGKLDFQMASEVVQLKITFELPKPGEDINPLVETESWYSFSESTFSDEGLLTFSPGLDTIDINEISIYGLDTEGNRSLITDFFIHDYNFENATVAFTTDYSGSMLTRDLESVDDYYKMFYSIMPNTIPVMIQIFSDSVTPKSYGFTTDSGLINSALKYDPEYQRSSTALFDAWSQAIASLNEHDSEIKISVLMTDGYENSSLNVSRNQLNSEVLNSNVFNIVIASGWAETKKLKNIVGAKGLVFFKYQIDEAQALALDIKKMLGSLKLLQFNDLTEYNEIQIFSGEVNTLTISF